MCLCGRVPLFKLSNQLTDFYETWYVQYVIGAYPNAVHFTLSFLTTTDAQSCELGGVELSVMLWKLQTNIFALVQ